MNLKFAIIFCSVSMVIFYRKEVTKLTKRHLGSQHTRVFTRLKNTRASHHAGNASGNAKVAKEKEKPKKALHHGLLKAAIARSSWFLALCP